MVNVEKLLGRYFCDTYNIDLTKRYEIEYVNARELLVPGRIDLIAKYKYIEAKEKGYNCKFINELYDKHIEAFSAGSYNEPGNDEKNSIKKYIDTFEVLIKNIKKSGIDETISVIPVGKNNEIMNGAHRTAIASYFNLDVPIIRFDNLEANYGTEFFRERLLEEKYLDYLVTEYCKLKENVFVACVWPKAKDIENKRHMKELISKSTKIIYEKQISLSYNGLRNLMIQIYSSENWSGSIENNFEGVMQKVDACYDKNETIDLYVMEGKDLDSILDMKEEIRDIFKIETHSIHITDNSTESVQVCNLLLNDNSLDLINNAKPDTYIDFNKKIINFRTEIIKNKLPLDNFIIESGSVMALYGLRDSGDIDFLTVEKKYECLENEIIENHNHAIDLYNSKIEDILFNPENFLVYNDMKFVTLKLLRVMKKKRKQNTDKLDLELIDNYLRNKQNYKMVCIRIRYYVERKKRNLITHIKILLKKLGLFKATKKVYYFMIGKRCSNEY